MTVLAALVSSRGQAADPFGQKLSAEKQVTHVLNRLAYGPRPGDVAEVRRLGVDTWMRRQLHPDQISESAGLQAKMQPLQSLRLTTWQTFEKYQAVPFLPPPPTPLARLLSPDQIARLDTGTADERKALLASFAGDLRRRVLLVVPTTAMAGLDAVQIEAFNARQADNEARTAELRRLRPPLQELLTQEQLAALMRGTDEDKTALLTGLDPETRTKVLRQVPPAVMPQAFRRQAMVLGQPAQIPLVELIDGKVYRALHSQRQLEEVLVDFWLNHFNVFSGKGPVRMLLTSYERDAIRPHVFGRFRDLLLATARHPAMLFYLDNWQSQARRDDAPLPAGSVAKPGLNENYGRELMELHTLGVDGGYTQDDVINVARAFTGWTIHEPTRYGEFFFNPVMHDREEKIVLGHTIARGGGEDDGLKVIDILVRHPSTARFIARKLAQRFVADVPPTTIVSRMADTFRRTDGDLRAVLDTMIASPEFMSEGAWRAKLKSPFELVVSALRGVNAEVTDTVALAQRIADLGQPLYGKLEPTGYPNTGEIWASSANLLGRMNFALALTGGQISGVKVGSQALPAGAPGTAARLFLGIDPSPATLAAIEQRPAVLTGNELAAVLIASPDFQKR